MSNRALVSANSLGGLCLLTGLWMPARAVADTPTHYVSGTTTYLGQPYTSPDSTIYLPSGFLSDVLPASSTVTSTSPGDLLDFAPTPTNKSLSNADGSITDQNTVDTVLIASNAALHAGASAFSITYRPFYDIYTGKIIPTGPGPDAEVGVSGTAVDRLFFFGPSSATNLVYNIDLHLNVTQAYGTWVAHSAATLTSTTNGNQPISLSNSQSYLSGMSPGESDVSGTLTVSNGVFLTSSYTLSVSAVAGTNDVAPYATNGVVDSDDNGVRSLVDALDTTYFTITPVTPGASYISDSGTVYDGSGIELPEPSFLTAASCLIIASRVRRRPARPSMG